ncbi:MAG: urea ABC transporter substrate-binding protein [Microcoleaceae cyanobacterium]
MVYKQNRRQFLIKSAASLSTTLLLKACSNNQESTGENIQANQENSSTKNIIKIGILHSLTGTMAMSEKNVVDAELLAIEEINNTGGLLGKKIEPIIEDGASDLQTFAKKANELIKNGVVTVFGCWTSASRKVVLPIFESQNHMLWYPVQYEGQECSKNIFYTGATPNQQIEPAVKWLFENKGQKIFLIGSDYVFPRTANAIVKAQIANLGGEILGESYLPLGSQEVVQIIEEIQTAMPGGGVIFNCLNGDSNIAFFRQLSVAGLRPDKYPVMSVSIAEPEVKEIGIEYLIGHYAVWNYFMTVDTPENQKFIQKFQDKYGENRVTNDPMEAAYIMVYLWKQAVETAGTANDLEKVRQATLGQIFNAPQGKVKMENNHHLSQYVRIGEVRNDGLFEIVFSTPTTIKPQPWSKFLTETNSNVCDWSNDIK